MAVDKLAVYNAALLLLGQRALSSLTEDRAPRHNLDSSWDLDAEAYVLEIVKPKFALKTALLTPSTISQPHSLGSPFQLPSDYIEIHNLFGDAGLDQPIARYMIEGSILYANGSQIWLRYVYNPDALGNWTPAMIRVLTSYLAREISVSIAPSKWEAMNELLSDRVEIALGIEGKKEDDRPVLASVSLTNTWRHIYNDALMIMGLDEISNLTDDSNRRAKLDRVVDAGIVSEMLEDVGWNFALKIVKISFDPSLEPDWGYSRVLNIPTDLHRLDGVFSDEYMQYPLKLYNEEDGNYYCDLDEIYIQYISSNYLTTPDDWPMFFRRLIASKMANDAAASLVKEGANLDRSVLEYEKRRNSALSNDAVSSPPRILARGNWIRSRHQNRIDRDRP